MTIEELETLRWAIEILRDQGFTKLSALVRDAADELEE